MEKKKTSPIVYIVLLAVIIGLGVFIVQRLRQNAEDKRVIDKTMNDLREGEAKAMGGK